MTVVANTIPAEVTEARETLLVRNVQGSSKTVLIFLLTISSAKFFVLQL